MDRGFTLIEVLVAMVILSVTFVTLLASENQGIDMAQRARFMTTATLLAQDRIGTLSTKREPFVAGDSRGDFGEDYEGYTYVERREATPLPGYFKYTLTVHWGGESSSFETEFITFLSAI